jgi:hypothetical protein
MFGCSAWAHAYHVRDDMSITPPLLAAIASALCHFLTAVSVASPK